MDPACLMLEPENGTRRGIDRRCAGVRWHRSVRSGAFVAIQELGKRGDCGVAAFEPPIGDDRGQPIAVEKAARERQVRELMRDRIFVDGVLHSLDQARLDVLDSMAVENTGVHIVGMCETVQSRITLVECSFARPVYV